MATTTGNDTAGETNMSATATTTMPIREYDARGAMLFTVATVLVYGMSIVAFIAGHLRRRHHSKEEQSQISKYLKRGDEIRRQAVRDDVLRLRSQLLASSEIVSSQNTERRKSRVKRAKEYIMNDINCAVPEGSRSPSTESLILPACTIPPPCLEENSDKKSSNDVVIEISSPDSDQDTVSQELVSQEATKCDSDSDHSRDEVDLRQFVQVHGGGDARRSLRASLDQSVINGLPPQPLDTEENDSPEGSPDFNKSRNYRSRRRGVVLNVPLILSQGPQG